MKAYITYCSAEKDKSEGHLWAIKRYKSQRIDKVYNIAKKNDALFLILSGKYGILEADSIIEYYDHLLNDDEVHLHSEKIAKQLNSKKISHLIFYTAAIASDKKLKPYVSCIIKAADVNDIYLEILEEDFHD